MAKIKQGEINEAIEKTSLEAGGNPGYPIMGESAVPGSFALTDPKTGKVIHYATGAARLNLPASSQDINDPSRRVGDYVIQNGTPVVAPKSVTGLAQEYANITGGTERQIIGFGDWMSALGAGIIGKKMGYSEGKNVVDTVLKTGVGMVAKSNPVTGTLWGLANMGESLMNAQEAYNRAWAEHEVDYESAVEFYKDDNGELKARLNIDKAKTGGIGSGRGVLNASDTTNTAVRLDGDNKLSIDVSDVFAGSKEYQDVLNDIKENFPQLTKELANQVVDDDTGTTRLQAIENYVREAENQYLYSARSVKALKDVAPNASAEALAKGSYTMLAGYVNDDNLKHMEISIYNEKNVEETVNAETWFDSIKNMDKTKRNDYMESINNRIASSDISDNEKAILQAQANALYAASDGDGKYNGIYQKDFLDAIGDAGGIFTGLRLGTVGEMFGGYGELTAFRDNEVASGLLSLGSSLGRAYTMSKVMNKLESGIRKVPGLSKLSSYAPQDVKMPAIGDMSLGQWAGKTTTQVGFQLGADALYDGAVNLAYIAAGEGDKYDYWQELGKDFLLDTLMTYGPNAYVEEMTRPKYRHEMTVEKIDINSGDDMLGDGKIDLGGDDYLGTDGKYAYFRDVKLVEVTAKELSMKRAALINKLTDTKVGMKVQELFFDKNAAMGKLAVQVLAKTGNNYLFRKLIRLSGDIRQVTRHYANEFNQDANYKSAMSELGAAIKEYAPKNKNWSKEDANYVNAMQEKARALKNAGDDKNARRKINEFYRDALNGVDAERATQLNALSQKLAAVAAATRDMYVKYGLLTSKEALNLQKYEGYFPVYTRAGRLMGGDVKQTRASNKSIFDPSELISLDDIDDPFVNITQYINNTARNVALNEKVKAIREAASIAGIGIHISQDTGGALKEITNLRELNTRFEKRYNSIVKQVESEYPTQEEWQASNDKIVKRSKAMKKMDEIQKLQDDNRELGNKLRRLQRAYKKTETNEIWTEMMETKFEIEANRQRQVMMVDEIREDIVKDMQKAQKISKNVMELDIKSYADIQLTNSLKAAFRTNNATGQIQGILNAALEKANPYIDRNLVIQTKAEEAAVKFRKEMNKNMAIADKSKKGLDRINELADKATDSIVNKVIGKRGKTVRAIGSDDVAGTYDTHGQKNVIRYRLDGEEYTMRLTGNGAEALVEEFNAPEFKTPKTIAGKMWQKIYRAGNKLAQAKRYLTTSMDPTRVLPNLARDWTRGIVTTGGTILLSPDDLRTEALEAYGGDPEATKIIENGFDLVYQDITGSTLTKSMETPRKNRSKNMRKALTSPDGSGFTRFVAGATDKIVPGGFGESLSESIKDAKTLGEKLSVLQDAGETYTRTRAMTNAYYSELSKASAEGVDIDTAVKRALESAYFYGEEATNNFFRRGTLISKIAQQVPYLTQRFATLESFKNTWLDNPIAVTRSLRTTVSTYTAMIALLLSNEESRKNYYMLSEYDRANNIIFPLDNNTIVTIPLDDTIAAFLTPYRRIVETMNGVDPASFFVCFGEGLEALSPLDLSGFSEGDKFNIVRGFEKIGSQLIPTWAQPIIENYLGHDLYYGSDISVDSDYVGAVTGNYNPTPGQMTTKSKNSKTLASISNTTGMPQWQLQNLVSEYGGNVGQYILNVFDKAAGATEEEQGGKEFQDAIFKPFTGMDSANAKNAFYAGINGLKEDKEKLKNQLKTIQNQLETAVGNDRANILNHRQEIINNYGTKVSDFLNEYLSAYEITGGLSKSQANQIFYLYKIYDEDTNKKLYLEDSAAKYYADKESTAINKYAAALASKSGVDQYINRETVFNPVYETYNKTYAQQAFENSVYGDNVKQVKKMDSALKDADIINTYYDKIQPLATQYYDAKNYDAVNDLYAKWDAKVMQALLPVLEEYDGDIDALLSSSDVINYLKKYIKVPSTSEAMGRGKYYSSKTGLDKQSGFIKSYVKKLYKAVKGSK